MDSNSTQAMASATSLVLGRTSTKFNKSTDAVLFVINNCIEFALARL